MLCINQNLSVMGVASCRSTFLCLMLSVRLVPFRISVRDLIPFSGRARRGFSIREVARPNLVQPSRPGPPRPARPWRPNPPCAPSPLLSLSFGSPAQQPLLSLFRRLERYKLRRGIRTYIEKFQIQGNRFDKFGPRTARKSRRIYFGRRIQTGIRNARR